MDIYSNFDEKKNFFNGKVGFLMQPPSKKSFYHQGFFAVKRGAVFILGGGMEEAVSGD